MPCTTPAPSKAGPAEQAQLTSHSEEPRTVSPLVPTSMNSVVPAEDRSSDDRTPAVMSAPT